MESSQERPRGPKRGQRQRTLLSHMGPRRESLVCAEDRGPAVPRPGHLHRETIWTSKRVTSTADLDTLNI